MAHGLGTYDRLQTDIVEPSLRESVQKGRVSLMHAEKVSTSHGHGHGHGIFILATHIHVLAWQSRSW